MDSESTRALAYESVSNAGLIQVVKIPNRSLPLNLNQGNLSDKTA